MIWGIMEEAGKINLADYFPILEKIDLQKIRYRTNVHFGKLFKLLGDLINERLEEKQSNHGEKNDVLEVLLNLSAENPKGSKTGSLIYFFYSHFICVSLT